MSDISKIEEKNEKIDELDEKDTQRMFEEEVGNDEKIRTSIANLTGKNVASWDDQVAEEADVASSKMSGTSTLRRMWELARPASVAMMGQSSTVHLADPRVSSEGIVTDDALINESVKLAKIEEGLSYADLEKKVLRQGEVIVQLSVKNQRLTNLLQQQSGILSRLEKKIGDHEHEIRRLADVKSDLSRSFEEKLAALSIDMQKRFDSTVEIHKETPELVERLIQATQMIMSQIPEDLKRQVSEVKLEPKEATKLEEISRITSSLTPSKKRIPKKFRR